MMESIILMDMDATRFLVKMNAIRKVMMELYNR